MLYRVFPYSTNFDGIPNLASTDNMKSQSTLSKAFSWSKEMMYRGRLLWFAMAMVSLISRRWSCICLPGTEHTWDSDTISDITVFRRFAKIFLKILASQHWREMGLQLVSFVLSPFLGIKEITAVRCDSDKIPFARIWLKTSAKSPEISSLNSL